MATGYIDLLKETRAEIITRLKRRGTASADALASDLGISKVAIRRHLEQLESHGLVEHTVERCDRGRPRHLFSLTRSGDGLFPDTSASFARELLAQVADTFGTEALSTLLSQRTDTLIAALKSETEGLTFDERVEVLVRRFSERGYAAEVSREADGAYRVVERNCPTRAIAGQFPELCEEERRIYREVTGGEVVHDCWMVAGATTCEYRIVPRPERSARSLPVLNLRTTGAQRA